MFNNYKDESDKFRAAVTDGILLRAGIQIENPAPGANEFRHLNLLEIAAECLQRATGRKIRSLSDAQLLRYSLIEGNASDFTRMQGTSDFPLILANVANMVMQKAHQEVATTYQQWVKIIDNKNFKEIIRPQFSEAEDLDIVVNGGSIKNGEFSDTAETYKIYTYGKKFCITRQAIINDDLNQLVTIPKKFGAAAARKVNATVYWCLAQNQNMADGLPVFHIKRNNLTIPGETPSVESLGKALAKMRRQKGLAGVATLNITPKFIIVPDALAEITQQVVLSQYDPAAKNDVTYNPFYIGNTDGTPLTPIIEPLLDLDSQTAWYLAADSNSISTMEVAFLNGQRTPYQEQRVGFDVDGLELKVRIDFGCKVIDFRGLHKNVGT